MDMLRNDRPADAPVIAVRDLRKSFAGTPVLRGVSMDVPRGTSAVVMGASGVGKSVLIRHIVKLLEPDAGAVWLNGTRVDRLSGPALDQVRLSVGFLFQGGALFDSMTVRENLSFSLDRHTRMSRRQREERIAETLNWVGLGDAASQYPAELSGGQKRRIGFARAIILQPAVMLYDEPTSGLDPVMARTISDLIVRLRDERGTTSITITHDLLCTEVVADAVYFLDGGRFVASGTLQDVRHSNHPVVRAFFDAGAF